MPLMKSLGREAAVKLAPELQNGLDHVGRCIDLLRVEGRTSPGAKQEWLLTLGSIQDRLVDLTLNANRSARKGK